MRRKTAVTAAAGAAALSLVAGVTAHQAGAFTAKELKVCWDAPGVSALTLPVTVSGPEFGSRVLTDGNCKAWDVKAGTYRIKLNTTAIHTLFHTSAAGRTAVCGSSGFTSFDVVANNLSKKTLSTVSLSEFGGSFNLKVQKNRLSRSLVRIHCM